MGNTKSYITVLLGQNKWALAASFVEEIVPVYNYYDPGDEVAEYVIGVINYRGALINLVDTKKMLLGSYISIKITNKVLIVKNALATFALLVDDVEDIVNMDKPITEPYFTYKKNTYRVIDVERISI